MTADPQHANRSKRERLKAAIRRVTPGRRKRRHHDELAALHGAPQPPARPPELDEAKLTTWQRIADRFTIKFPELTYASPDDHWTRRYVIRTMEYLAGRSYFVKPYLKWQSQHIAAGKRVIEPMLPLIDIDFRVRCGAWPPALDHDAPLVIVSNHPYGVLDGIGALRLAEDLEQSLGRPFKVLIHKDLMKIPEIREYCLPISFDETREAQAANIKTRNEALQLLKDGTTIVVFPAGGVATAPKVMGEAVDLPWKTFTARLITAARAQVLPLYFEGQCSRFFMLISQLSPTLRLALMIRELRRRVGTPVYVRVGDIIPFEDILEAAGNDRKAVMTLLFDRVHAMADRRLGDIKSDQEQLPAWLLGGA